jgi:hypothetical protein
MNPDSYRRDVQRYQKEIAQLQQEKAREAAKAASETKKAGTAADAARRSTSISTVQSKIREAQRFEANAVRHQQKVAEIESRIAQKQGKLNDAHRRLGDAEKQLDKRRTEDQQRAARGNQRVLTTIRSKLDQHTQLHNIALSTLEKLQQPPATITVLFLAANPLDQAELRLDEEVRSIGEMIRKAEHHDAVRLESRWAVRPLDVLQAINECRPGIVHFSGHGSQIRTRSFFKIILGIPSLYPRRRLFRRLLLRPTIYSLSSSMLAILEDRLKRSLLISLLQSG